MTVRTLTRIVLLVLVQGLAGCGGSATAPSSTVPATPSPRTTASFPPAGYTLSNVTLFGVVFEETLNSRAPIQGVAVYCELCGAGTHTWSFTDSNGFYSFTEVWTDPRRFPTSVSISKDGYADPDGLPNPTPPNYKGPGGEKSS